MSEHSEYRETPLEPEAVEDVAPAEPPPTDEAELSPPTGPRAAVPATALVRTKGTPSEPPPEEEPEAPKRRLSAKTIGWIVGVALFLLLLCIGGAALFAAPYLRGSKALPVLPLLTGDHVVVRFLGREGDDLYLLELGQEKHEGTLLAEEVEAATADWFLLQGDRQLSSIESPYGAFVPGLDWLVVWHQGPEEVTVQQMHARDDAPVQVLRSKGEWIGGVVFADQQRMFLVETRGGRSRCYVVQPNEAAQRLVKADQCSISMDGSTLFFEDVYGTEVSLSTIDTNGQNETLLVEDVEGLTSYRSSDDSSHVAYVQQGEQEERLYLLDRRGGEPIQVGEGVDEIVDYGFIPGQDVVFYVTYVEEPDVVQQLYTSESPRPLATGEAIYARAVPDGTRLVYLVREEDRGTLYVHTLAEDEPVQVSSGQDVTGYDLLDTIPQRLVFVAVGETGYELLSANLDGQDVVTLLSEEGAILREVSYVAGQSTLYAYTETPAGESALAVTPVERAEPISLLSGWTSLTGVSCSPEGEWLVFQGQQVDQDMPALYSVAVEVGAEPILLDDAHPAFGNAVFMANGRSVLYTAFVDESYEDADICQVPSDGSADFESLYEKAFLVDVIWGDVTPFRSVFVGEQP